MFSCRRHQYIKPIQTDGRPPYRAVRPDGQCDVRRQCKGQRGGGAEDGLRPDVCEVGHGCAFRHSEAEVKGNMMKLYEEWTAQQCVRRAVAWQTLARPVCWNLASSGCGPPFFTL